MPALNDMVTVRVMLYMSCIKFSCNTRLYRETSQQDGYDTPP